MEKDTTEQALSPQEIAKRDLEKLNQVAPVILEYCKNHEPVVFFTEEKYYIGNKGAKMTPSIKK